MSNKERGMTLIEVLVSMMLLSLGLVGILSLQLKGAVTIRESGTVGYAPVVVDSLIEAMRSSPALGVKETDSKNGKESIVVKNWDHYGGPALENGKGKCKQDLTQDTTFSTPQEFADLQKCNAIQNFVKNAPPSTKVKLVVCPKESAETSAWPTYSSISCQGGGEDAIVKIAWTSTLVDEEDEAKDLKLEGDRLSYGYLAIVERQKL